MIQGGTPYFTARCIRKMSRATCGAVLGSLRITLRMRERW
jgi:hypothetical protein